MSITMTGVLRSLAIKKDQGLFYLGISAPLKEENLENK